MIFISSEIVKAQLKLSVQDEVSQTLTILGESYRRKCLWRSDCDRRSPFIEKMFIKQGYIFYQTNTNPAEIRSIDKHAREMSGTEFHAPSYLNSITLSHPEPQFLTLGETVIKTECKYKQFMVAEHITKKIYFIASNSLGEDGSLYAADVVKGTTEVVAEKVDAANGNNIKLSALAVDQLTGNIILAFRIPNPTYQFGIYSFQKSPYLHQTMAAAEVSSSKETDEQDAS